MRRRTPAVALLALLPACSATTRTVEVRNESRRQVAVTLERDQLADDAVVLARAMLGAGDSMILGPASPPPFETVYLRVARPGQLGDLGAEVQIPRGRSTALIEDAGVDSWGSVSVRLLAGGERED